ncbi:MAG: metallophosphoesterase family protein [Bacteroidota bacterium]|nr:metallophosphatase family protein [Candidatus Kapabacteria bacterium]MCS7301826.1 metallophosphatase family protein [Candidatus Kapabacteria bacterium]MCX7936079.1 metallophosphatase family protein [Chlorobiota bacterium]MDW8075027.1 metallophosphoesterase family protein [Bacteroidota bacterium]MDW8271666.1 metallophosphoesterase family protein [Bacteroidota bacterium]
MRIALISDIHANLPALEACLEDVAQQQIDAVYCLGDLVGYNVWPNEVIERMQRERIPTIAGNYDVGIGTASDDCGCAYKTDHERALGKKSIAYTNATITESNRAYLRRLPSHFVLEYRLATDQLYRVYLVHGSPRRVNEYLYEDRSEESLRRIVEGIEADILVCGHTHIPYHRTITAFGGRNVHIINAGAVGKPKDGDPRACYCVLTLTLSPDGTAIEPQVEFRRVPYDIERAASAIIASPLPDEYAEMLRYAR